MELVLKTMCTLVGMGFDTSFLCMENFMKKLINFIGNLVKNNTGYSSKNFFLIAVTLIGLFLLLVPAIILLVEVFYNHTIQTNLDGMAAYITSVAAIFASAGITKAWSEKYEKHNNKMVTDE